CRHGGAGGGRCASRHRRPRQGRAFARALGHLAETAAHDAQVLAHFAEGVRPTPRPLPDAQAQEFTALLARRRQLVGMLTAERQRLDTALAPVRAHLQRPVAWLEQEVTDLERTLRDQVRASPVWASARTCCAASLASEQLPPSPCGPNCPNWAN